jgi:hypothetical protein
VQAIGMLEFLRVRLSERDEAQNGLMIGTERGVTAGQKGDCDG